MVRRGKGRVDSERRCFCSSLFLLATTTITVEVVMVGRERSIHEGLIVIHMHA